MKSSSIITPVSESNKLYTPAFVSGFLYNLVISVVFTNNALFPLFVEDLGGGPALIGIFMSLFAVVAVLLRPFIGKLIDRKGPVLVVMLGAAFMSIPTLGYIPFVHQTFHPVVWIIRIIQGFGFGAHFSAAFTYAALIAPPSRRNEAVAMYGVSGLAGNLFGPALGEYIIHAYGFASFFIMLAGFGVLGMIIASTMRVQKHHHDSEVTHSLYTVARSKWMPLVMVLAAFLALAYSTPTTFMAAVALSRGIEGFGLYFTGYGLAGIMIRFVGAKWGDRFGSLKVLVPAFFFYGAGLLLVAISTSTYMVFIAGLITGFSHGLAFPAVAILGYSVAPRSAAGTAMALVTGTMDAGQAYTALIIGPLAEVFGYGLVFPFAAVGCFTAVLITLRTLRVRGRFVEGA